ncbi:helix-turn-helix domain-containing protein [Pedobacter duraquae]|uniref:Helix-turn-helix protein n=1 Tax=Pedobacter duraquae TaxID=425511 RepID=A0A4R6IPF2_9SPHI|nr:helix-turn-helix domain-containing protein [Pedobacter duraquae]TDO23876.1 helix-turn-helix protein [Pedobacter duraquae]
MSYQQFQPDPRLSAFIDAYWTADGVGTAGSVQKILPDGCVDILVNIGEDFFTDDHFTFKNEQAYLVGTMTRFKYSRMLPGSVILGIRFKPGGFAAFFKFDSLHNLTDQTIPFDQKLIPEVFALNSNFINNLDIFFLSRLNPTNTSLTLITETISAYHGQIQVTELAKRYCITTRQLERVFKQHIGVSPKELINISRFQFAMEKIRQNQSTRSLMQIAFECGYYDHAHLSNEIKKYSGDVPSFF